MKHRNAVIHCLAVVLLSQFIAFNAQATLLNTVIDTSSLSGTNAQIAFDFVAGDGAVLNSVAITNFLTDGSLDGAILTGDVTGTLPATSTLQNTQFFNEILQGITFGNSISFSLNFTENSDPSGFIPDTFSVFLLDTSGNPLFDTNDPTTSNALFQFNINGAAQGDLLPFTRSPTSNSSVTWSITPAAVVPLPLPIWLFISGLFVIVHRRKDFLRTKEA